VLDKMSRLLLHLRLQLWKYRIKHIFDIFLKYPAFFFLLAFVIASLTYLVFAWNVTLKKEDLLVEAFGFLMDLIVFGVLLSVYDNLRNKRQSYHESLLALDELMFSVDKEHIFKKVNIISRVLQSGEKLPMMTAIELSGSTMDDLNLQYTSLKLANLQGASLQRVNLRGAHLQDAFLQKVNFSGADLRDANIPYAHLEGAQFGDANLEGAWLIEANLENADLSNVNGLSLEKLGGVKINENTKFPKYLLKEVEENLSTNNTI